MKETINKYKVDALVIAAGVFIGLIGASIAQVHFAKAVELAKCSYYTTEFEKATQGHGTLTFSYFGGCEAKPTGK